jgi:short-subunit dehydrogenase
MKETIWVVGASSGIGAELALQLAQDGLKTIISARRLSKLEELKAKEPVHLKPLAMDICDPQSVLEATQTLKDSNNLPETIVINAGIYTPQSAKKYLYQNAFETMNTNYLGVCRLLEQILPAMIEKGRGRIVIVASVAGYQGLPKSLAYGPSKAALINLAEGLSIELKGTGVLVQIVNPGFVKTPLTSQNKFPMPFLMEVSEAAHQIRKGMQTSQFEIAFPRPFVFILKTIRLLPYRFSLSLIKRMTMK